MKFIKKSNLKELIEPFLHPFLESETYEVFEVPAQNLLTYNRLDLIYKITFLRAINKGINYYTKYYLDHIRSFNFGNYFEFGNPNKNSESDFLSVFKCLDNDIEKNGFDSKKSIIPLAKDGSILNGSHRVASSIVRNKTVSCIKLSCEPFNYNYDFFTNRLVNQKWLEEIILNYVIESDSCSIALIWPRANLDNKTLNNIFKKIIYIKEVKLNLNGLDQLIKTVYKNEKWISSKKNDQGSFLKTTKCFKVNKSLKLIVFQSKGNNYDLNLKSQIRDICGIGNHSIHTSDTKNESIRIARILLNRNSINLLNGYINEKEKFNNLNNLNSLIFENKACVRIKRDCVRFFFLFFLQFLGEMITFFIL